jgi:hypothetical protein
MYEPPEEQIRVSSDDVLLPFGEGDSALMLAARRVLGEEAAKLLRLRIDLDSAGSVYRLDKLTVVRQHIPHCRDALPDDSGVEPVQRDPQLEHTSSCFG